MGWRGHEGSGKSLRPGPTGPLGPHTRRTIFERFGISKACLLCSCFMKRCMSLSLYTWCFTCFQSALSRTLLHWPASATPLGRRSRLALA